MSVSITGEFVQSSPLQMPQADVHSSPFLRHVHLMVLHPDLQSQRNTSINLDGAGGRSVVTGNSCPSLSFQPHSSGSRLLFGERLLNCGNVLLLTLVGGISLPLPLNLILLSHKIACSGGCSGRLAQIHCKDKLEHLLLP